MVAPPTSVPDPFSANRPDVRLAAAGDVGTGGAAEYATAEAMAAHETGGEFDASLLLGHNVYPSDEPDGVQSAVLDALAAVPDGPTELDLVLAGHDYQRREQIGGVTHVVSGGAATLRPTGREQFRVTAGSTYHFVKLAAPNARLVVRAVRQDARVFDECSLPASDRATALDDGGCD